MNDQTQDPEEYTEAGSDDSSVGAQVEVVVGEGKDQEDDEEEESTPEDGVCSEYEDPDAYGERLVDGEGEEGDEGGEEGQARIDRIRGWLRRQAGMVGGSSSRKRKRRTDLDNPNPRSRPRPRLPDTHGISDLQKVTLVPSIRRKPIRQVCESYNLDLRALMDQIGKSAHLTNLPISLDEYTQIDVWHALRTRLPSAARKSGTRMQRIRSKPATCKHAAKFDPVLYVDSEGKAPRTAKLQGPTNFSTDPNYPDPEPPDDDVFACVQQDSTIRVQGDGNANRQQNGWPWEVSDCAGLGDSAPVPPGAGSSWPRHTQDRDATK
ncbi:hypothetical protein FRC06_000001 [Ceratobasidium sp. 370]|nr:hypothetical protein FRC06_000001 [Ceratobasidium sp. 370]